MTPKLIISATALVALTACNSSTTSTATMSTNSTPATTAATTPTVNEGIGSATISGSTYTVTTNGSTISLPAPNATVNGVPGWVAGLNGGTTNARQYEGAGMQMIAGSHDDQSFAGITGTPVDPGLSGTATYAGTFFADARAQGANTSGPITLTADFSQNTLKGDATDFNVNGRIQSGGVIDGEATYKGDTAPLKGGFYGADEANAVFNNGYVSGMIQTKKQ